MYTPSLRLIVLRYYKSYYAVMKYSNVKTVVTAAPIVLVGLNKMLFNQTNASSSISIITHDE